jgi:hypothetical protein
MKTITQYILPTLLISFFISCRKDNIVSSDELTFDVHVQHHLTKKPLANLGMALSEVTWASNGRWFTDTTLMFSKTNLNGDVTFKVKSNVVSNKRNIYYYVGVIRPTTPLDSMLNEFKYFGSVKVYNEVKNTNHKTIEVYPSCQLKIQSFGKDWTQFGIDSLFVFSKLEEYPTILKYEINMNLYYFQINSECSETNTIRYYYYSKGIKSKEYYKDIYVPFSSQNSDLLTCTLDFK